MRINTIPNSLSIVDLAKAGYWFCLKCERVTEPVQHDNGQPDSCTHCGAAHLKWCPPVPQTEPEPVPVPVANRGRRVKKVLVQFISGENTRWTDTDERLLRLVKMFADTVGAEVTSGDIPEVSATLIEH